MPWATTRPAGTQAKYRSKEHRNLLASYKVDILRHGYVDCQAVKCVIGDRAITNIRGMEPDGVTVGHMPDGVRINGPEHRACNLHEAAVRANKRSRDGDNHRRWVF